MSRELRFRAWDEPQKEMRTVETINFYYEEDNGFHAGYEAPNGDWVNCPIMQFTGLHDCNGVAIFEGDIVHLHINYLASPVIEWVEWYVKDLQWVLRKEIEPLADWEQIADRLEVIGNIHENPELLESQ